MVAGVCVAGTSRIMTEQEAERTGSRNQLQNLQGSPLVTHFRQQASPREGSVTF